MSGITFEQLKCELGQAARAAYRDHAAIDDIFARVEPHTSFEGLVDDLERSTGGDSLDVNEFLMQIEDGLARRHGFPETVSIYNRELQGTIEDLRRSLEKRMEQKKNAA